jgi:hypothetical protein
VKWTHEKIIREILRRESTGLPLNRCREQGVDNGLYAAGARVFGSWPNAVRAAGIAPSRAHAAEKWPPGKIQTTIRTLSARRRPLRPGELQERYSNLIRAAQRHFGSWSKAVIAAGVDPSKLMRAGPWTRDRVIEAILKRALNNEPLGSRLVQPRSLVDAAVSIFGTWQAALAVAGLDPKQYMRRRIGSGSSSIVTRPAGHDRLTSSEKKAVGSANTLTERQRWSHPEVLQAILARLHEQHPMNAASVRREDISLYRAASKRHRSWSRALQAAGLNPKDFAKNVVALGGLLPEDSREESSSKSLSDKDA